MEELLLYLNSINPLSLELYQYLRTKLKSKHLQKKDILLKAGHINKHIFFVVSGLVRCYYQKNAQEISSWFMKEGDVIISVESFFKQTPSKETIQALEPCELLYLEYAELQHIYRQFPEFNYIGRVLTEKYYALSEERLASLRMRRSSERYQFMMQHYPQLINRVPSKYIASYLGLTEETLSRIRSTR